MIMLINKVGIFTKARMEGVNVTFPSMGLMRAQNVFLLSQNPEFFYFKLLALPSTKGRGRGYPAREFPASVRTGQIFIKSLEMFP